MDMVLEELTAELLDGPQLLENAGKSLRGVGKKAQALVATMVRELTPEDIDQVGEAQVGVNQTPLLKDLKSSHHRLAQLLAKGYKDIDAARITGYSQSRISILKNDPAFKELMSHYTALVDDAFADTVEKMKHVTDDALSILHERMLDEPESFSNTQLVETVKTIGDRAGYSPITKSVNLNAPVDAQTLAAIKEKVKGRQHGQVKQINQEAVDAEYSVLQGNRGADYREAVPTTPDVCEASEVQGGEGEGVHV